MPSLGNFYIPAFRLYPTLVDSVKRIFDKFTFDETDSDLLAQLLGYAAPNSGTYSTRRKDMMSYGLLETGSGRGKYKVTQLGSRISHPRNKEESDNATKEALLNIPLWKELYRKYSSPDLPTKDLWVDLSRIAHVEAPIAKNMEAIVRKTFSEDMVRFPAESSVTPQNEPEHLSSGLPDTVSSMAQQFADIEEIPFAGKYSIKKPKAEDINKSWQKLKKYMEIYLEDFKQEESKSHKDNQETESNISPDN